MDEIDNKSIQTVVSAVHPFAQKTERICRALNFMAQFAVALLPHAAGRAQSNLPDSVLQFGSNAAHLLAQTTSADRRTKTIRTGDSRVAKAIQSDANCSEQHTAEYKR